MLLSGRPGRLQASVSAVADMPQGFAKPPREAGVRCWWWWLNSNVTKEAITRDLQEMKAKGFSGAMIFDAGGANQQGNQQVPPGPLYGSEKWRELYKHALKEAKRLGLILGLSIQSGWNLGGPNVTPEFAAKQLTFSQIQVEGPTQYDRQLPLPENHNNYYKDICVLAYLNNENNAIASKTKRTPIKDLKLKVGTSELGLSAPDCRFLLNDHPSLPGEEDVFVEDVIDISEKTTADGRLIWNVPKGKWTVLRFGYTITDAQVSTYSGQWKGHVVDYLSRDAFDRYWNEVVVQLLVMEKLNIE